MPDFESQSKILNLITGREPEAIARTLAMMAYVLAIGRALMKGGVKQFQNLMWETIPKLYYAQATRDDFDKLHAETCQRIISTFRTSRQQPLWYGQAQKPLNVFLKVYIDLARQPTHELAERLTPFLHIPLDSLLMQFFARELPGEYEIHVAQVRRQLIERTGDSLTKLTGKKYSPSVVGAAIGQQFSLKGIDKETYLSWQNLFRSLYPAKPVMLDIIWSAERLDIRENGGD